MGFSVFLPVKIYTMHCVGPKSIHTPPKEGCWKFLGGGGGGVLKAKLLEQKYELKLN